MTSKLSRKLIEKMFPHRPIPATITTKRPDSHEAKLTVVLDIDETLVHTMITNEEVELKLKHNSEAQLTSPNIGKLTNDFFHINIAGEVARVHRRPHLSWFLKEASQKFELVTFTAGEESYASMVLNEIDPDKSLIPHRFFRQHCTQLGEFIYTKDLSDLNRSLSRTVLVDNNPVCFIPNPDNGIPVNSFYGQTEDSTLKILMGFLDKLNEFSDVRPVLKQRFGISNQISSLRAKM